MVTASLPIRPGGPVTGLLVVLARSRCGSGLLARSRAPEDPGRFGLPQQRTTHRDKERPSRDGMQRCSIHRLVDAAPRVDEAVVRTATENVRTLHFTDQRFGEQW